MEMLSVQQIAALKGCNVRNVKALCQRGALPAEKIKNKNNRDMYVVPLSALDENLQVRYFSQQKPNNKTERKIEVQAAKPYDAYSDDERAEIDLWQDVITHWQDYRNMPGVTDKASVDTKFVRLMELEYPRLQMSVSILYRKWAALRSNDLDGLLDKRGTWRRGKTDAPQEIIDIFTAFYLTESQYPIKRCIEYTQLKLQKDYPQLVCEMPSYSTFRRKAMEIPEPVRVLGRYGAKAYYDRCSAYIRREYESIASNEWWVADTHTFDILVKGEEGKTHRIYINAYLDARSGIFTGWYITPNPSSEATLLALRKGIQQYGIPKNIYVDNGREYLTYDIGGLGHRAKRTKANGEAKFEPPGVFKRLGIEMTNAIVRNARAKLIERRFRDVKDHISRLFLTYTGGTVVEKPDRLKAILKADKMAQKNHTVIECSKVVSDDELVAMAEQLISGYMNYQPYGGSVTEDKGLTRIEVYHKHYNDMPQRRASDEDLALMLMRSTRPQQVGRNGVCVPVGGAKVDYCCDELRLLMGRKVYLRYDPECMDSVRVYDLEDRYILTAPRATMLSGGYGISKEQIKEGMRYIRAAERTIKQAVELKRMPIADPNAARELVLAYAAANLAQPVPTTTAKAIEIVRAQEQPLLQAAGAEVNITRMTRNASRRKKEEE